MVIYTEAKKFAECTLTANRIKNPLRVRYELYQQHWKSVYGVDHFTYPLRAFVALRALQLWC